MSHEQKVGRSAWQQGWNAGYAYARDGTMTEAQNPFVGTDPARAAEWDGGYSQGLDDSFATTWLGGGASDSTDTENLR